MFPYLFDQVPGEAVIGGELQADLGVDVGGGLSAAAHHQGDLQAVGRPDLHGLGLHVAQAGAGAGLSREAVGPGAMETRPGVRMWGHPQSRHQQNVEKTEYVFI